MQKYKDYQVKEVYKFDIPKLGRSFGTPAEGVSVVRTSAAQTRTARLTQNSEMCFLEASIQDVERRAESEAMIAQLI